MASHPLAALILSVAFVASACAAAGTPSPTPAVISIYLVDGSSDGCDATRAVERTVAAATPEAALRALLAGPTPEETGQGYVSWFSAATAGMLESVATADGVARVSFGDLRPVIPNASSSCGSAALLSALDSTIRQFPEIRSARYSIRGDEAAFYEWLQRGVPPG